MKKFMQIVVIFVVLILTSCATKQVEIKTDEKIEQVKKPEIDAKIVEPEICLPAVEVYSVSKNFLDVLQKDTYASICKDKNLYEQVLNTKTSSEQNKLLEKMLLKYTYNLVNSCIDIKDMKKKIAKNRAKKIKNSFNIYRKKVDEKEILRQFRTDKITIAEILEPYQPQYPTYFSLVNSLNDANLSKTQKYRLRLNIERMKLIKTYKSENFIQLNIPSYSFDLYEQNQKSMSFGTVVGDLEDQTPVFSSSLSYFIMNPAWNIPDSIAKKSIIPRMLKDKKYLKKKHIVIRKNYSLSSKKYNQQDIKWDKYLKEEVKYIPYKFIQLPSNTNGMGRVKFIFPNQYAVYMHDTIGTWRFKSPKQSIRAVSHGCVRLENPKALIKHLSTHYTKHSYKKVKAYFDSHNMKTISLSKKLPVHVTYITAYLDSENKIQFYNDIYSYDSMQKLNFSL